MQEAISPEPSKGSKPLDKLIRNPRLKMVLAQPVGTPFKLTREEALEMVRAAAGARPDLLTGEDFVRETRQSLGRSVEKRRRDTGK